MSWPDWRRLGVNVQCVHCGWQASWRDGDPFIVFSREDLHTIATPLLEWFEKQGVQHFGAKERIAWGGKDYEGAWRKYDPPIQGESLT